MNEAVLSASRSKRFASMKQETGLQDTASYIISLQLSLEFVEV